MPYQSLIYLYDGSNNEVGVRINGIGKDGFMEILYANIPGGSWNPQRLEKFRQIAQEDFIDVRTPLDDPSLVDDEFGPSGVDPATVEPYATWGNFFWDTAGPNNHLVARPVIIHDVSFDPDFPPAGHLAFAITDTRYYEAP